MTFWKYVYGKNKKIFYFFLIFACIELLLNITKKNISPMQIWGVFSSPYPKDSMNTFYKITYNNNQSVKYDYPWQHNRQLLYTFTLQEYDKLIHNNFKASHLTEKSIERIVHDSLFVDHHYYKMQQTNQYPEWLHQSLEDYIGEKIYEYKVEKVSYKIWKNKLTKIKDSILIQKNYARN